MSREIVLQLKEIALTRGATPLFSGVDLTLLSRERVALVGPNGVGKSTLLKIISGDLEFDKGERVLSSGINIATQNQEPEYHNHSNLIEWVMQDIPKYFGDDEFALGAARAKALSEINNFGLNENMNLHSLSGGEARRAALARVFAAEPQLMLLDEPTNHLDIAAIEALEARLKEHKGAILLISHDRKFLENVSTSCVWLKNGKAKKLNSGFSKFDEWAQSIEEQEQKAAEKLNLRLKEENHWLSRGVTARRSRNMGRLRRLMDMREERVQILASLKGAAANVTASSGALSSKLVLEAKNLTMGFDDKKPLIKDFDLRILRGDRIGIVGPNGIGKSTLIKTLLGELNPISGNIRRAKTINTLYLDQTRSTLDPKATLWDAFAPNGGDMIMVQDNQRHVAAYAKDFLFTPNQLRQPIGSFSGGERNRVLLAVSLARASNFLVLDEPTNDLDMDTLDVLEEVLANYDGTIILVSHDRAFLDNVVTSTLSPIGDGKWRESPGGYSDLENQDFSHLNSKLKTINVKKSSPQAEIVKKTINKLSYKDTYRLQELEKLLPQLNDKKQKIDVELHDANLYLNNPDRFEKLSQEHTELCNKIDEFEFEWLELEEKKTALSQ